MVTRTITSGQNEQQINQPSDPNRHPWLLAGAVGVIIRKASKTEQLDNMPPACQDESTDLVLERRPAPVPQEKPAAAQIWKEAVLPYLGTRVILVVIGLLATYYVLPLLMANPRLPTFSVEGAFPQSLLLMWDRFDSGFYVAIAKYGYGAASTLHNRPDWVFYPLYPLLISRLGKLVGASVGAFQFAGVLIANVAGVGMIIYFYLLVRHEFDKKIAARAIIYLAVFPLAFFLSALYTESLLLCLSIACIYYARKQNWWLAGLCGGLAALTRLQGVALIIPLSWEYLRVVSARYAPLPETMPQKLTARTAIWLRSYLRGLFQAAREMKNWVNALALVLVPCGLLAFMVYGQVDIGDFFATFHASLWGWGRQLSPPWRLLIYSLRNPILGQPLNWNFWVLNIVAALAFLAVIVWACRRLPMIYTLYTAVTVLLPLSSNSLNSLARYYLLVFPAFMLLALLTSKGEKQNLHNFLIAGFAALQAILMVFFVLGLFAIA
jgi:hypothetical protein